MNVEQYIEMAMQPGTPDGHRQSLILMAIYQEVKKANDRADELLGR